MKTKAFVSVLSLALIFAAATAGFSSNKDGLQAKASSAGITYKVMIHSDLMAPPSGVYMIWLTNEKGEFVATPQAWVPGVNIYTFREKFSAAANPGSRRIAKLVMVKPPYMPNSDPVFATPDIKIGPFVPGQVYLFNLYVKNLIRTLD